MSRQKSKESLKPPRELISDEPLPRPKRRKLRAKADRGLPPDVELQKLATAYLQRQAMHWPEVVARGLLPKLSQSSIREMVKHLKACHRTGEVDPAGADAVSKSFSVLLGGVYGRFSCDNSSPNSIIDQLVNALDKAKSEGRFIPWCYVFCDYSVSGLDSSRQGYTSYKAVLASAEHSIDTTYIDDFTRASRDEIEWWKLASLSKQLRKRLIGASDGFDLSSSNWDLTLTMYGLVSRLFVKGLREKVRRGMKGAARRGTCLGKLPLGFTRCVQRDSDGNVVYDSDGQPVYRPCADPGTREHAELLFELFIIRNWSPYKITQYFNQQCVDGANTWSESTIKGMLRNPAYVGIFIWNQTRSEFDYAKEKWVKVKNPTSEWVVFIDKKRALIPLEQWKLSRRKLGQMRRTSPLTGKRQSRNQTCATTLFSGTLFCGYCGQELTLYRSAGKYKSMFCLNGRSHARDCQLSTSKSTRIIEECLLGHIKDAIFRPEAIEGLVDQANAYLAEEAAKPQTDLMPLKERAKKLTKKRDKLVSLVEDEEDQSLCDGYHKRVKQIQKELDETYAEIRKVESQNCDPPEPLDASSILRQLNNLRELLSQETPAAAAAIRQLTGPITIQQSPIPNKDRGAIWTATFSPRFFQFLQCATENRDYPDSVTLEFLTRRNWINHEPVTVQIDSPPKYEELAAKVQQLHSEGTAIYEIARTFKLSWLVTAQILQFAETGQRPLWETLLARQHYAGWDDYKGIAESVARLRDEQLLGWREVADETGKQLGAPIPVVTVLRAYEYAHGRLTRKHAGIRVAVKPRLGQEMLDQFKDLLATGITNGSELARRVGCSRTTANRWKRRLAQP